ncbi:MAG: sulfatase-like hydrolase/transferase, partial [Kiritimatiellales bacterium]|nr:sulfatase-like hydrolase/transferase [Kiritimatiellales bacterium]
MHKRPNILFIMTDQQRADAMGCSGGWGRTPDLDRLAAEGLGFTNALTNSPVCIPARVSQVTRHYPHKTHI